MAQMTYRETCELFTKSGYEMVEMGTGDGLTAICPRMGGRIVAASVAGPEGRNPFFVNPVDVRGEAGAEKLVFRGGLGGRDWLGPEGCGDMSFYFRQGPLTMENWYVDDRQSLPAMRVAEQSPEIVTTVGEIHMPNLRGNLFDIELTQAMRLMKDTEEALGVELPAETKCVSFERTTTFKNIGTAAWDEKYGQAMIWFLLMLRGSDDFFIVAPIKDGGGREVIDYEFDGGPIGPDRLQVRQDRKYLWYKGDGRGRGKIGQTPARAAGIAYGLDLDHEMLTVLTYDVDPEAAYLDNRWTEKAHASGGDVMDAYNNFAETEALPGRFCEIEAVSPALALRPDESAALVTSTTFIQAKRATLLEVIQETSGCDLTEETFGG